MAGHAPPKNQEKFLTFKVVMKKVHFTREQRYTISVMHRHGYTKKLIAQAIGKDKLVVKRPERRVCFICHFLGPVWQANCNRLQLNPELRASTTGIKAPNLSRGYRKVNIYAALPITFETAPIFWNGNNTAIVRPELMILPSFGCRYGLNKHWGIEASGELGLGRYYKSQIIGPIPKQEITYGLSVGLRYTF